MTQHKWKPTTLNHGTMQCEYCHCTEREAAFALGMECSSAPATPPTPATEEPWEGPLTDKENAMLEAAWQKHKDAAPPTPATEEREAVARAYQAGAEAVHKAWVDTGGNCPGEPDFWEAAHDYADAHPFVAAEILAAEEREAVAQWCSGCHEVRSVDCYRAGCPKSDTERRAAEILAAEARGIKRARTVVQDTRDGMKFDPSATLEWRNAITGGFNAADLALRHELDAIERGEHGAGK